MMDGAFCHTEETCELWLQRAETEQVRLLWDLRKVLFNLMRIQWPQFPYPLNGVK